MSDETPYGPIARYDLIHALQNREFYKLAVPAMREVGPAALTLAGLYRITNRETYMSAEKIAKEARVSVHTARKQLVTLEQFGWITNAGRQPTRIVRCPDGAEARIRRTNTLRLTAKAKRAMAEDWNPLPWWAYIRTLPWSSRAVLSVVLRRLLGLMAAAERENDASDSEEIIGFIENCGGPDKFRFSLDTLVNESGLSRPSVVEGKAHLARLKLVEWSVGDTHSSPDVLWPNWDINIVAKPINSRQVNITFQPA